MAEVIAGRFRVMDSLGHGGMSRVVLARDMSIGRDVALKIIHPHLSRRELIRERIMREVAFTRSVRHPGVIEVYDFYQDPETDLLCVAMEYLPGGSLKDRLEETGSLPLHELIRIGTEALDALTAAHDEGIVHRDIKPHNILFDADGRTRLTDFGLAAGSSLQGLTAETQVAGTPEYCAPEIIRGEFIDARADIYSMGVTMYEAATGKLPFRSNLPYHTLQLQLEATPESIRGLNPQVPEEIEAIILRAMKKDPGDRFQTAVDFAGALRSGRMEARIVSRGTHICGGCGAVIPDALPYCFTCRDAPLLVSRSGKDRYRVVVIGPGKPGEKFSADLRDKALEILKRAGADSAILEKRIPRLPFVLLKGIDRDGAREVEAALNRSGIESIIHGPAPDEAGRRVRGLLNRKTMALVPRIWLIVMGSMGGMWGQIGKTPGVVLPIIAGTFLLGVPLVTSLVHRRPLAKLTSGRPAALTRLLKTAENLNSRHLQSLIQRIAVKIQVLNDGLAREHIPETIRAEVASTIDGAARETAERLQVLQDIDTVLRDDRELREYTESVKSDGLRDAVERRRRLELYAARLVDSLLRFSSRLDGLCLSLAATETLDTSRMLKALSESAGELDTDTEAYRELERFLNGTTDGDDDG